MKDIQHKKLSELIREKVAYIVEFRLQDPRRSQLTLTVTHVKLAKDLSHCTVFYSCLGGDKEKKLAAHMLKHAQGFVRSEMAKTLETRRNPQIEFEYDDTIEKSIHIARKIDEVMGNTSNPNPQPEPEK